MRRRGAQCPPKDIGIKTQQNRCEVIQVMQLIWISAAQASLQPGDPLNGFVHWQGRSWTMCLGGAGVVPWLPGVV